MGFLPGFRNMQWLLPPDGRDISYPQFSSTLHSSSNLKLPERACTRFSSLSHFYMVLPSLEWCHIRYHLAGLSIIEHLFFSLEHPYTPFMGQQMHFSEMRNGTAAIRGLSFSNTKRRPILEMERLPCFNAIASAAYFLKLMTGSPALTGPSCVNSTEARSSVFVRAMITTVSWPAALILSLEKESRGSPAFT